MNADGFAKAMKDIWQFLIPPVINLFFLGATIQLSFGQVVAPQIVSLKQALSATSESYFRSTSKIIEWVLSLLPSEDVERFITTGQVAIVSGLSKLGDYLTVSILVVAVTIFSVAVLINYMTIFVSKSVKFVFSVIFSFHPIRTRSQKIVFRLRNSNNITLRALGRSIIYFSSETPPHDKYVAYASDYFSVLKTLPSPDELHKVVLAWLRLNFKDAEWSNERAEAVSHLDVFNVSLQYIRVYILIFILYHFLNAIHFFHWPNRLIPFSMLTLAWLLIHAGAARWKREVVTRDMRAFYFYQLASVATEQHVDVRTA